MVAPVTAESNRRNIYMPKGDWYDFRTTEKVDGGKRMSVEVPLDRIPIFVKAGTILLLAIPTLHTEDPDSWKLAAYIWGENNQEAILYEDNGAWNPELAEIKIVWDNSRNKGSLKRGGNPGKKASAESMRYSVEKWEIIS